MQQARFWLWPTRSKYNSSNTSSSSSTSNILPLPLESWEEKAFAADAAGRLGGYVWPPRSYSCCFCRREFRSAQALGGHMNVHRRDRARLRQLSGDLSGEAGEEAKHASTCLPLMGIEACQPNPNSCAAAVPPLSPRTSLPVAMHSLHRCAGPELRLGRPTCDEFGSWRWSSDLRSLYEDSSSGSGCSKRRRTGHAILPVGDLDLELRLASGPKI